jgi:hypothetical protein
MAICIQHRDFDLDEIALLDSWDADGHQTNAEGGLDYSRRHV